MTNISIMRDFSAATYVRASAGNQGDDMMRADGGQIQVTSYCVMTPISLSEGDEDPTLAQKIAAFRLPLKELREKAKKSPPPPSWFDEDLDIF